MREEVRIWWLQSQRDFENAQNNLEYQQYYLVAFLTQQAVEKALKACFLHKKQDFAGKTHSLVYLGKEVNLPEKLLTHVRKINPDFVLTRYPDMTGAPPYEAYDKTIAQERIQQGKEVLEWIKKQLTK